MSLDATRWAWTLVGLKPSEKLVLLSLADRAGEAMTAHPSIKRMELDTGLNRKTIIRCFDSIEAKGLLVDTGRRVGRTSKVKVYQLVGVECREKNGPKNGASKIERMPEHSADKQSQNGDHLKEKQSHFFRQTDPLFPGNSPKTGTQNLPGNLPEEPNTISVDSVGHSSSMSGLKRYPDWFETLWKSYPPRFGSNDKRRAFRAASARIREGKTIDDLLDAVRRYSEFVAATGKLNTEFVKQASTFFGPGGHIDNPWRLPNAERKRNRKESLAERSWRESEAVLADVEASEVGDSAVAEDAPAVRSQVGESVWSNKT